MMKKNYIKELLTCLILAGNATMTHASGRVADSTINRLQNIVADANNQQQQKIAFIENKGQWPSWVLFKADVPGGQAIVTKEGMMTGMYSDASLTAFSSYTIDAERYAELSPLEQSRTRRPTAPVLKGHGWKLVFDHAKTPARQQISSNNKSADYYNFLGDHFEAEATNVHSFDEIVYNGMYDGIDIKYYTAPGGQGLENDIIIHPGADAAKISMHLEGIEKMDISAEGALILHTSIGDVAIPAPYSYTMDAKGRKTPVVSRYALNADQTIGFQLGSYDKTKALVIDPVMMRWGTWASANGTGASHNHGIDLDKAGNIYVAGYYGSAGLITTGAFQSTNAGTIDCFFGKYTEPATPGGTGTRLWQTYLGGTANDILLAIVVGDDNNVYATGYTSSVLATTYGTTGITPTWTNRSGAVSQAAMLVKVLSSGAGAVVRTLNGDQSTGTSTMTPYAIKTLLNANGSFDIVIAGYAALGTGYSGDGDYTAVTTPAGTALTLSATTTAAMALRISSDFNTISWRKLIAGGSGINTNIYCAAVDAANNIYIGGNTTVNAALSYNNPSAQTTSTNATEGILMKINPGGTLLWSRYFLSAAGITNTNLRCMNISYDNNGLFIGGVTGGLAAANITTGQTTYGGGTTDLFVARLPLSGTSTIWGTYMGGSGTETNMMGLNQDKNNDIYILGYTGSTDFPIPAPATTRPIQGVNNGADDAVFCKLSSNGSTVLYATYLGGANSDSDPAGNNAVKFSNCRIYLAITAASNTFPLTSGALTTTKTSATTILEPVLLSMANPPDFSTFGVTPATQTIACNTIPADYVASTPVYNVPALIRNGVAQTSGTPGAYPNGAPTVISYQWQRSIDNQITWTDITGATALTLTAAQMGTVAQNTHYRLVVNGDACNPPPMPVGTTTVTGAPTANPTPACAGNNATISANASGIGTLSYVWTLPAASTRANPGNVAAFTLTTVSETDAGFYTVTVTNASGCKTTRTFNFNTSACRAISLPVVLTEFNAQKDNSGTRAMISWKTAGEMNTDYYEIERSADGKNFKVLGRVAAAGNTLEARVYDFTDLQPEEGKNYYRLLIADRNGVGSHSQTRLLVFSQSGTEGLVLYPNPAVNEVSVSGFAAGSSIRLLNSVGSLIVSAQPSTNTARFSLEQFPAGMYLVQVVTNGAITATQKLIIAK